MAQNLSSLAGAVTIYGGSASDTLNVFDQASSDNEDYTLTSSTLDRPGMATVTYFNLARVALTTGSGADTSTVQSAAAGTAVAITGGGGIDTLAGPAPDNTWDITGSDTGTLSSASIAGLVTFSFVQNLTGGPANNRFVFHDGASLLGDLEGGGGTNTLDYSAYTGTVIVNLPLHAATGVGGQIADIQVVFGGSDGTAGSYNILVGNGGNVLTGGSDRPNLLIAGSSSSTLQGGEDDDILVGGTTLYDRNPDELLAIMDYWTGTDDYDTRVFNLTHGIGVPLLDATTVAGNGGGNTLFGGAGQDLFYGSLALDMYDWDPLKETFIAV
jgi:Ca2+-binding RTX toxin-like protein